MLEDLKRQAQSLIQKAAAAKATDKASDALGGPPAKEVSLRWSR
jgi:hypothetical protein